ncbi:MAG TPA: hypothetical protein VGN12_15995 [Pirellulales bacterium]
MSGSRIEGSVMEAKAEWIPAEQAARRLAGHANAAGGQEIIWIFGLDEDAYKLAPLDGTDPSKWLSQLESQFENGHMPRLAQHRTVTVTGGTVHACQFDTLDAPYVVRNPKFGTAGHSIEREVPWREGASTRTARRADLLKLLLPISRIPPNRNSERMGQRQ